MKSVVVVDKYFVRTQPYSFNIIFPLPLLRGPNFAQTNNRNDGIDPPRTLRAPLRMLLLLTQIDRSQSYLTLRCQTQDRPPMRSYFSSRSPPPLPPSPSTRAGGSHAVLGIELCSRKLFQDLVAEMSTGSSLQTETTLTVLLNNPPNAPYVRPSP